MPTALCGASAYAQALLEDQCEDLAIIDSLWPGLNGWRRRVITLKGRERLYQLARLVDSHIGPSPTLPDVTYSVVIKCKADVTRTLPKGRVCPTQSGHERPKLPRCQNLIIARPKRTRHMLRAPIYGAASVPIPKFARFLSCELWNQRDTRKYIILVRFLDLKFL